MSRSSRMLAVRISASAAMCVGLAACWAQPPGSGGRGDGPQDGRSGQVYQRRAFDRNKGPGHENGQGRGQQHGFDDRRFKGRRHFNQQAPNVQSRWFQRPYPYHLDFYKMKYGGSYAPYFGNLYGPPQVVTAPPYYGPYYGGWGFENEGGGYGPGRYGPGAFGGAPAGEMIAPGEMVNEGPVVESAPNNGPALQPNGESLPAPGQ